MKRCFSTSNIGWNTVESQRQLFEHLASRLKIKVCINEIISEEQSLDDWYKVDSREVINNGGGGVLAKYEFKLERALFSIFPGILP